MITRSDRWRLLADVPVLAMAVYIVVLLLQTHLARVGHPFNLEWMEGGMLVHAQRVMDGQPLYVEPSADFIPFIYPPLYHWVLGWCGKVFGLSYALGRTIALLGTLAAAAAAVAAVAGERRGWLLGLGAGALYLTGYDESGSFYDLVRADGLLMGLLTWALVAARHGWVRTAGLLLTCAFLAKHNAAAFGIPIVLWLWRHDSPRRAQQFALWSMGPALAATLAIQLSGDGLFLTYLLGVPAVHPFKVERFALGTPEELFGFLPLLNGVGLAVLAWWLLRERRWSPGGVYWASCGGLAVLLSAVMRGHHGGYINVLMPGLWAVSLWGALAVGWLRQRLPHPVTVALTGLLVAGQVWEGQWTPSRWMPSAEGVVAGEALIERLSALEGEVFAPHSPWYLTLAGKPSTVHLIALWDIDHPHGPLHDRVVRIKADMLRHRWSTVVLGARNMGGGENDNYGFQEAYRRDGSLPTGSMKPVTGWPARPQHLYVPRLRQPEPSE